MLKRLILPAACAITALLSGCATVSKITAPASAPAPQVAMKPAWIKGSEESSALFDNFTAFIVAVNGREVAAGRAGWDKPVEIPAGANTLTVEFNRGNFIATADLELVAKADASYELKFASDTKIFGQNSYCDFWIVDLGTGQAVTPARKAPVKKR